MPHEEQQGLIESLLEYGDPSIFDDVKVISSRSCIRALAKPYLFNAGDYFLKDAIEINAVMINDVLLLQRRYQYESIPAYGFGFEKAMVEKEEGFEGKYHNITKVSNGKVNILLRNEIDCYDGDSSIELATKKLKRKKNGHGYYPLLDPAGSKDKWFQMVLAMNSRLDIGARCDEDEGALIQRIERFSVRKLAEVGELSSRTQLSIFERLFQKLQWIIEQMKKGPTHGDGTKQCKLVYNPGKHDYNVCELKNDEIVEYPWLNDLEKVI